MSKEKKAMDKKNPFASLVRIMVKAYYDCCVEQNGRFDVVVSVADMKDEFIKGLSSDGKLLRLNFGPNACRSMGFEETYMWAEMRFNGKPHDVCIEYKDILVYLFTIGEREIPILANQIVSIHEDGYPIIMKIFGTKEAGDPVVSVVTWCVEEKKENDYILTPIRQNVNDGVNKPRVGRKLGVVDKNTGEIKDV